MLPLIKEKNKTPIIFMMGGPGSGKGTQCNKLKELGYHHIALGDILRKMIQENAPENRAFIEKLKADMKAGVSSDGGEAIDIIKKEMAMHPEAVGFLIDGYPRTPEQLVRFEREIGSCDTVLYLETTTDIMQQRMLKRAEAEHRIDDTTKTFTHRIQQFSENTQKIIEVLRKRQNTRFLTINASENIDTVFQRIKQQLKITHVSIIGLAGRSGSGKTTIAKDIAEHFGLANCATIPIDMYYKDLSHLPLEERKKCNFDDPSSIDFGLLSEHLTQLKQGNSIEVPFFDFQTMTRKELSTPTLVHPKKMVIVEGIFALYPENLLRRYNATIYVHTDDDVCLARRILRDETPSRPAKEIIERYLNHVKPMKEIFIDPAEEKADFVFNNNSSLSAKDKTPLFAFINTKIALPQPNYSNDSNLLFFMRKNALPVQPVRSLLQSRILNHARS